MGLKAVAVAGSGDNVDKFENEQNATRNVQGVTGATRGQRGEELQGAVGGIPGPRLAPVDSKFLYPSCGWCVPRVIPQLLTEL